MKTNQSMNDSFRTGLTTKQQQHYTSRKLFKRSHTHSGTKLKSIQQAPLTQRKKANSIQNSLDLKNQDYAQIFKFISSKQINTLAFKQTSKNVHNQPNHEMRISKKLGFNLCNQQQKGVKTTQSKQGVTLVKMKHEVQKLKLQNSKLKQQNFFIAKSKQMAQKLVNQLTKDTDYFRVLLKNNEQVVAQLSTEVQKFKNQIQHLQNQNQKLAQQLKLVRKKPTLSKSLQQQRRFVDLQKHIKQLQKVHVNFVKNIGEKFYQIYLQIETNCNKVSDQILDWSQLKNLNQSDLLLGTQNYLNAYFEPASIIIREGVRNLSQRVYNCNKQISNLELVKKVWMKQEDKKMESKIWRQKCEAQKKKAKRYVVLFEEARDKINLKQAEIRQLKGLINNMNKPKKEKSRQQDQILFMLSQSQHQLQTQSSGVLRKF